jgi:hypothetical protein
MHITHPTSPIDSRNSLSAPPVIEIRSLAPCDDATAFRTLNEEWITRYFTLEAKDRETLNNPVHSILLKGGHIFMAYAGAEAVGCVALIPMQNGVYELSKNGGLSSSARQRPRPPFACKEALQGGLRGPVARAGSICF